MRDLELLRETFRQKRASRGLSYSDVAEEIGVHKTTLQRFAMTAGSSPDIEHRMAIERWTFVIPEGEVATGDALTGIRIALKKDPTLEPEVRTALFELMCVAYESMRKMKDK